MLRFAALFASMCVAVSAGADCIKGGPCGGVDTQDMSSGGIVVYDGGANELRTTACTMDTDEWTDPSCDPLDSTGQGVRICEAKDLDGSSASWHCATRNLDTVNLWGDIDYPPDRLGRFPSSSVRPNTITVPFCGEGPAASTPSYLGPQTNPGQALDDTACDTLGDATVATADAVPWGLDQAPLTPLGMWCYLETATTSVEVAFSLYADASAASPAVTCSDANGINGVNASCAPAGLPSAEAAGTVFAVMASNSSATDYSGATARCEVTFGTGL